MGGGEASPHVLEAPADCPVDDPVADIDPETAEHLRVDNFSEIDRLLHPLLEGRAQRVEGQKLIADARAAAENVKNDLMQQAQEEIGAERERAKKEINLERAKAVDELKQVTVELTLEASARLLKRELRDEDHRRLAREVVEEVSTRL